MVDDLEKPARRVGLPAFAKSLSARLLILTIGFVMIAEVLIFAPSVGRYRLSFFEEKLAAGHLAVLALEATPDNMVSEELERELLTHVGAVSVGLFSPDSGKKLMLMAETPEEIQESFDLREAGFFSLIMEALSVMAGGEARLIRVVGNSPKDEDIVVDVVLDEIALHEELVDFGTRILLLSLLISVITAALVYLTLHLVMVRPMRRITENMTHFSEAPEDATRIIRPSARSDEIGVAQRELAQMQQGLRDALQQKTRLAALGVAVNKINHDLRNILASASLVSERLEHSEDPEVRRVTPTVVSAINRAINLCAQTLNFTREGSPQLNLSCFQLQELAGDVGSSLPSIGEGDVVWRNRLPEGLKVEGDREQLYRVLYNLGHNAIDIGATEIEIAAEENGKEIQIDLADNGPGLSPRARRYLFQPFFGSARSGGSGLGLAIARDLMQAHGGEIVLARSDASGTCFRLTLPLRQETRYKDDA
ncbi:MAG: HAMP domain-containing sensor histidine kinase [Rhodovibrionaceae bacterium]